MRKLVSLLACAAAIAYSGQAAFAAGTAPTEPKVYIVSPADGAMLTGPVTVRFGLSGMGVAPAGVDQPNTGHHHLLIDVDKLPPMDQPIPKDNQHRHFGGGQTETVLELPPGKHTLQLILGDAQHMPHVPPVVSQKVSIVVEPSAEK